MPLIYGSSTMVVPMTERYSGVAHRKLLSSEWLLPKTLVCNWFVTGL